MDQNCKVIHETSLGHIMDIWDALMDIKKEAEPSQCRTYSVGPAYLYLHSVTKIPLFVTKHISVSEFLTRMFEYMGILNIFSSFFFITFSYFCPVSLLS